MTVAGPSSLRALHGLQDRGTGRSCCHTVGTGLKQGASMAMIWPQSDFRMFV